MLDFLTPADFLARGLQLPPLAADPMAVPPGTECAITGQPIGIGYPVAEMVTGATNEFLDCFRGGVAGYVSDAAARCFKNASPGRGNPTARAVIVFEDGEYHRPLISRDSAIKQERECWSDLVRMLWPTCAGRRVLIILTTDYKRRLWIRARVGALGPRTPVLLYDAATAANDVLLVDWSRLIECLDLVEEIYTAGFVKAVIRESLLAQLTVCSEVGWRTASQWEERLKAWRGAPEFQMATLIAQKGA